MSSDITRHTFRFVYPPLMVAVATLLIAATVEPDANWLRLQAVPRQERQRLIDNLQKFDLRYSAGQQQSLRDIDRRINELEPARQAQYLATLHRYHIWLNQLPELKQGDLKEKPPGERMAIVKKLLADHPLAPAVTTRFLQFVDVGDLSPFELAAIYRIWKELSPSERQQVEKMAPGPRRQNLFKRGEKKKVSVIPEDFDEAKWVDAFRTRVGNHRPALLAMLENEADRSDLLRRQAINYHFVETKNQIKAVTAEHLADFLRMFPPWLQSSFDHYSPEEARRRLTVVYRLVFPPGVEIKVGPAAAAPSTSVRPKAATPRVTPSPAGKTSSTPDGSPF